MSKEITWEEALKKRYSEKPEKKNEDTEITGFKREFNFKRMNTTKKENKYYHTELLELDSKKILKNVTEHKKEDDLAQRRKEAFRGKESHKIINASYTVGAPTANWKSWDNEKIKEENLKRTLSGQNVKMVPNMGNGFIAATEKIEGTEFHTLKIKPSVSNKNVFKTLALPVEVMIKENIFQIMKCQ